MWRLSPQRAVTLRVRGWAALGSAVGLLATVLAAVAIPAPASAAGAYEETHKVARVLDGDTIEVYATPGATSGAKQVVRLAGVNTNEPGMCHATNATNRLTNLIEGKWVTLSADDANSKTWDNRFLRFVEKNGVDMSLLLIQESRGFAFPNDKEPARNDQYVIASHNASHGGQRIWDPTFCGSGPHQSTPLRMIINWDAPGEDGSPGTFNGEFFRIFNEGGTTLNVAGWTIRDTAARNMFTLPSGTQIPGNGFLTIYVGSGTNTSTKVYLGLSRALFHNDVGDAGFLLDPDDDIRAHFTYPCIVDCTDPLQGDMDISANPDAAGDDLTNPNGEWINITNTSNASFNLHGYLLRSGGKLYTFPSNSTIHPDERMRLYIGSGSNSRLTKYWGQDRGILANNNPDFVQILTYDDIVLSEFSWPCDPCGPVEPITVHNYQWDAGTPGPDSPNDEWIELKNEGNEPVDLRDWLLMDNYYQFHFDDSKVLGPGDKLRVYVGSGNNTASTMYWGQSEQILFSNDMIQVFSPHRDLVSCTAWGDKTCGPTATPTTCNGLAATIVGSEGADEIHGTEGDDVIVALGGNDTVYGHGGNDFLCGNDGHDVLNGGSGNDVIYGGGGDDTLKGRSGNDALKGNGGTDVVTFAAAGSGVTADLRDGFATGEGSDTISGVEHLVGSAYGDILRGNGANNVIDGGAGNDLIKGRGGKDSLDGQAGNDTIFGGGKADTLRGDSGTDTLDGGSGKDLLKGGPDADVVKGKSGADTLIGNGGHDNLAGGKGADTIDGGGGIDTCTSGAATSCEN